MLPYETLKTTIINNPLSEEAWLVYSDYLQTQGILQGELIHLHFHLQNVNFIDYLYLKNKINQLVQKHYTTFNPLYWPALQDHITSHQSAPLMRIIPAGCFSMGSPDSEFGRVKDKEILCEIKIEKPFAISQYAITYEEYDAFCHATQRAIIPDRGWGRGKRPIVNISWFDALDYCEYLSKSTSFHYRLPSEAEWEYACRAGTNTPFWWGEQPSTELANYHGGLVAYAKEGIYRKQTLPVDSFFPNPWGLYQMHGNTWEWTASPYATSYEYAQCVTQDKNNEQPRILKGGSWGGSFNNIRAAARGSFPPHQSNNYFGFRIVREIC